MSTLAALIITRDDEFKASMTRLLRATAVPVRVVDERTGPAVPDIAVVDIRSDRTPGAIEHARVLAPKASLFAVAESMDPNLILSSMRAGANEFFVWPPQDDTLRDAIQRTADRRNASSDGKTRGSVLVFLGAKGGTGTTTLAVNSASEIARVSKQPTLIVDLQTFLGEVALFLGVRPRFTLSDAIDNLHRLDAGMLKELVSRHKAGLDILAAADRVDRLGAADAPALERLLHALAEHYLYIVVDAGRVTGPCADVAVGAADTVYVVANPDVPSIRNTQRVLERVAELGVPRERTRVLLNRVSGQVLIAPKQIESALGHDIHHSFASDYQTVSAALNSGVPLTMTNHSELAGQFSAFTRGMLKIPDPAEVTGGHRRGIFLGMF